MRADKVADRGATLSFSETQPPEEPKRPPYDIVMKHLLSRKKLKYIVYILYPVEVRAWKNNKNQLRKDQSAA